MLCSAASSGLLCLPPACMHFCVLATRGGFHGGFFCPRKIGTNWFMPALVKSRVGASANSEDEGTMLCCFSRKKSRNDCRIFAEVMLSIQQVKPLITNGHDSTLIHQT